MTRRKTAKTQPVSPELLKPIRDRKTHQCAYCGAPYKIGLITRLLSSQSYYVTCKSCETSFFIPMSKGFDPSSQRTMRVTSDRWGNCQICRTVFKFSHCYEQCPCCGQLFRAEELEPGIKLSDNSESVQNMLAHFKAEI